MKNQNSYREMSLPDKQAGAVLAVSLIMLLLLTIIGTAGMNSSLMQERMTGNERNRNLSFQLAEAALRDGELYLASPSIGSFSTTTNTNGLYVAKTDGSGWWKGTIGDTVWSSGSVSGSLTGSKYIIEELQIIVGSDGSLEAGVPGSDSYYRVSARGENTASNAVVILQSVYKR